MFRKLFITAVVAFVAILAIGRWNYVGSPTDHVIAWGITSMGSNDPSAPRVLAVVQGGENCKYIRHRLRQITASMFFGVKCKNFESQWQTLTPEQRSDLLTHVALFQWDVPALLHGQG